MCRKFTFCSIFLLFSVGWLSAQSTSRIQTIYEKGDYAKTRDLVLKSLEKDTINVGAKYYHSLLFMVDPFRLNTDSARWFINSAIADLVIADEDEIKDLDKAELTEEKLQVQKLEVTNRAFNESTAKSTVESMDFFLRYFPEAPQTDRAVFIRDSLAYDLTKSRNTWQAYYQYLEEYPNSSYYQASKTNYDRLLFEERTGDNQLGSFIRFLKDHPETPYRNKVEDWILKRTTVSHGWDSYVAFLRNYPKSYLRKRVVDVLYYLDKSKGYSNYDQVLALSTDTDSINRIKSLEWPVLFPILADDKYGFLSISGEEIIEKQFSGISPTYYCGSITSEWLQVTKPGDREELVIARNGGEIIKGIRSYEDLGFGVILVDFGARKNLYHQSGFLIDEAGYSEAEVINGELIRTVRSGQVGLLSVMGQSILANEYHAIQQKGAFILVKKGEKYAMTNLSRLDEMVKAGQVSLNFSFDDFEVINDTLLLTFQDEDEALYDANLEQIIPEGPHQIFTYGAAWYIKKESGFQIFNRNSEELVNQTFPYMEVNNGWMAIQRADDWLLLSQQYKVLPLKALDSIKLINDAAAYFQRGDTLKLIFNNGKVEWLQPDDQVVLLRSKDQSVKGGAEYIKISSGNYHKVLTNDGEFLMEGRYDDMSFLTDSLLTFTHKKKKGIVSVYGKEIHKAEYDGIDEKNGLISLLKGGKIGCYNPETKVTISPKYESMVTAFGAYFMIAKNQKVGLIGTHKDEIIPIRYDELKFWNDTSFWARDSSTWELFSFENKVLITDVRQMELIGQAGDEQFYKVLKEQVYGVISNKNGIILEPGYNDIVNLGIDGQPLFFAEQHLKTADFYVVTYFDQKGSSLRSQAYRPNEYDKIYCDQ